ncbi:MAG: BatD family protein [Bacteroidales bacterium]|nr:BatD family protein [Bacteroidales bacterium]
MKKILWSFALCLWAACLCAQTTIRVSAPNLVAQDEQFNVTFTLEGEARPSAFSWDAGSDFRLVWGPQKGSSTSISIINGKHSKTTQTTYTYVVSAVRTGTFELPAATATVKGEQLVSRRVSVQVVSGGAPGSTAADRGGEQESRERPSRDEGDAVAGEDMFLRLYLSKNKVVVGETLTATLKLYQRVNVAGFEDARFPTFNGFWSQEQQAPTNIEFRRENVGDRIYDAAVLRSWTLIPQQAGEVAIEPAELVCLVNVRVPHSSTGSIFDSFFQDDYRTVRKRLSTRSQTVQVSRLPDGAPASFCGGVGSFKMQAVLSCDSLRSHDAASLLVTVSGKGNISLLEAPKIQFPPDFERYDTKVSEQAGSKTFEFPFIPRSHGDFVVGPVEYSYYDVAAGKYVTLRSEPLPLRVSRGTDDGTPAAPGGRLQGTPLQKDVKDLGSDIRYIRTRMPAWQSAGGGFAASPAFWYLMAALACAALCFFFAFRRLERRRSDVAGSRNRAAMKMARRRLSEAGEFLRKDLYTAFYEALHKALTGFAADKLSLGIADMRKEHIAARLCEAGASASRAEEFVSLLSACEYARYAPAEGHEAMSAHYGQALSLLSGLDAEMGKKHKTSSAAALLAFLLLLPPLAGQAAPVDSLWTSGCRAYDEGRWEAALASWQAIEGEGRCAPALYVNIADAYFKLQDYGHAILYYERALKADPSDEEARYNLSLAQGQVLDRIDTLPSFFLTEWLRKVRWLFPATVWAILSLVLFAALLAALLLFLLSGRPGVRKAGFFSALAALLLFSACLGFSLRQRGEWLDDSHAIVTVAVSAVRSAPGGTATTDLFILHEGAKVHILESVGDWNNIEIADGRQGWIRAADVERI